MIEQEKYKIIYSKSDYNLNKSIKQRNKMRKDKDTKKIVRNEESEEKLGLLKYGTH